MFLIFVSVNVHVVRSGTPNTKIENKNKILDPCIAFEEGGHLAACNIAGDCKTGTYTCVINAGVAECSDGPENEAEGNICDDATNVSGDQWTCDANGACVGKKIFIAFRI